MLFMLLIPFYDPNTLSYATAEEAEAKAVEMVTANPALVISIAEVTILNTIKASVTISKEAAPTT